MLTKFWLGNLNGGYHFDDVGTDRKPVVVQEIGYEKHYMLLIGPRVCPIATSCHRYNERSSFVKDEKILNNRETTISSR